VYKADTQIVDTMGKKKPKRHILSPDAINIFVDGAMDYDQQQTRGIGFEIIFFGNE